MLLRRVTPEDALDLQNLINQAFNRTTDWTMVRMFISRPDLLNQLREKNLNFDVGK